MNDEIRVMLERKIDRRTFLRGSGLAVGAIVGAAAFPRILLAQDRQDRKDDTPDDKKDDKKDSGQEKDPFKETKIDDQGREYRTCPQCGFNMYRQDRTWTCENCGYSYVE
jgi:hypothetical protein